MYQKLATVGYLLVALILTSRSASGGVHTDTSCAATLEFPADWVEPEGVFYEWVRRRVGFPPALESFERWKVEIDFLIAELRKEPESARAVTNRFLVRFVNEPAIRNGKRHLPGDWAERRHISTGHEFFTESADWLKVRDDENRVIAIEYVGFMGRNRGTRVKAGDDAPQLREQLLKDIVKRNLAQGFFPYQEIPKKRTSTEPDEIRELAASAYVQYQLITLAEELLAPPPAAQRAG